jgi:RNA polymerase sigma-70 factor (ECF subfamily)
MGARTADDPPGDEVGQALLCRWRAQDPHAFRDLFRTYRSLVYGVLVNLLPGDPEIEDVVQTAFLEVYRSLNSFEGRSKLSSWVTRVALHVGYHHLRRKKSRPADYRAGPMPEDLLDPSVRADPAWAPERAEAIRRVEMILASLAPKKRAVFVMNDLQGIPQEEVARIVESSVATVRTRLFYARKEFWKKASEDPVLSVLGLPGSEPDRCAI